MEVLVPSLRMIKQLWLPFHNLFMNLKLAWQAICHYLAFLTSVWCCGIVDLRKALAPGFRLDSFSGELGSRYLLLSLMWFIWLVCYRLSMFYFQLGMFLVFHSFCHLAIGVSFLLGYWDGFSILLELHKVICVILYFSCGTFLIWSL